MKNIIWFLLVFNLVLGAYNMKQEKDIETLNNKVAEQEKKVKEIIRDYGKYNREVK